MRLVIVDKGSSTATRAIEEDLDRWLTRAGLSRLEPVKKVGRTIRSHRQLKVAEIALYHALGHLPEPEVAHGFC